MSEKFDYRQLSENISKNIFLMAQHALFHGGSFEIARIIEIVERHQKLTIMQSQKEYPSVNFPEFKKLLDEGFGKPSNLLKIAPVQKEVVPINKTQSFKKRLKKRLKRKKK